MNDLPYTLVKYVHVLAAMVWVGGVFYSQVLAARAGRSDDPTELPRTARAIGALGLGSSSRRRSSCSSPASSSCSTAGSSRRCGSRSGWRRG